MRCFSPSTSSNVSSASLSLRVSANTPADDTVSPLPAPAAIGLYFARDIGYVQLPENAIFQELYWGRWLRGQVDPALNLGTYNLNDLTSYLALVKAASMAMTALGDGDIVSDGKTALELGKMALWNNGSAENKGELGKLSKPYSDAKPGKLAFALEYKANH